MAAPAALQRIGRWIAVAGVAGLLSGFALGTMGGDGEDGSTSLANTPAGSSTSSTGTASVSAALRCIGRVTAEGHGFSAVYGLHDSGVEDLARADEIASHVLTADEAAGQKGRDEFRDEVLAAGKLEPVLLVIRLDADPLEKLAADLIQASPQSAVILVQDDEGELDAAAREPYPKARTLLVAAAVGGGRAYANPWAERVLSVAKDRTQCTPPAGDK